MTEDEKIKAFLKYATPRLNCIFDLKEDGDMEKQAINWGVAGRAGRAVFDFGRRLFSRGGAKAVRLGNAAPKVTTTLGDAAKGITRTLDDVPKVSVNFGDAANGLVHTMGNAAATASSHADDFVRFSAPQMTDALHNVASGAAEAGPSIWRRIVETGKALPGFAARQLGNATVKGAVNTFIPKWMGRDKLTNFLLRKMPGISDNALAVARSDAMTRGAYSAPFTIAKWLGRAGWESTPYVGAAATLYGTTRKGADPKWVYANAAFLPRMMNVPLALYHAGMLLGTQPGQELLKRIRYGAFGLTKDMTGGAIAETVASSPVTKAVANGVVNTDEKLVNPALNLSPYGVVVDGAQKGFNNAIANMVAGKNVRADSRVQFIRTAQDIINKVRGIKDPLKLKEFLKTNGEVISELYRQYKTGEIPTLPEGVDLPWVEKVVGMLPEGDKWVTFGNKVDALTKRLKDNGFNQDDIYVMLRSMKAKDASSPEMQNVIAKLKAAGLDREALEFAKILDPHAEQHWNLAKDVGHIAREGIQNYRSINDLGRALMAGELNDMSDNDIVRIVNTVNSVSPQPLDVNMVLEMVHSAQRTQKDVRHTREAAGKILPAAQPAVPQPVTANQ